MTQTYLNPTDQALEIVYKFPKEPNTVLSSLDVTIGGQKFTTKVEELEQYQQTEEFQQKIAEAEREVREEFKKSEWWFATKIWVGFGTLMLVLIFTIVIIQ